MVKPVQSGGAIVMNLIEKAGAFQNNEIILNTKPTVDAAKFVRQLRSSKVIHIDTPQGIVDKKVRQAVLKARKRKLTSIPLKGIIKYTIRNKPRLAKQLGITSPKAKNPFTVVEPRPKQSKEIKQALVPILDALKRSGIN